MSYYPSARTRTGALPGALLSKVFGLLAFSMAFAMAGGVVGARYAAGWLLPLVIVEFALIFAIQGLRNREGLNLLLLYAFTFVSGMTLGPLIAAYVGAGLGVIVLEAVAITAVMTLGLSAYALTTRRNFTGLAPYLFMGLLALIVVSLIGLFVGGTLLQTVLSWAGALLFSVFLIVNVQMAKSAEDTMGNAVVITLSLYLTIVNLFLYILRILTAIQGGGRRN